MTPPPLTPTPLKPAPWPVELRLRRGLGDLEVTFDDGARFRLGARLLRAMTPSADGRGHGGVESFEPLPLPASALRVTDVLAVGRYAVRLVFDDGHDSGLFTWERLHRIGRDRETLEAKLAAI